MMDPVILWAVDAHDKAAKRESNVEVGTAIRQEIDEVPNSYNLGRNLKYDRKKRKESLVDNPIEPMMTSSSDESHCLGAVVKGVQLPQERTHVRQPMHPIAIDIPNEDINAERKG